MKQSYAVISSIAHGGLDVDDGMVTLVVVVLVVVMVVVMMMVEVEMLILAWC